MKSHYPTALRQKAVWGPKRIVTIAALLILGLAPNAMAAGSHARQAHRAMAGRPNSQVKPYKLDNELTFRAAKNNATRKTRVIVELVPGADVPRQFQSFVKRNGRLGIINGVVLDLPDRQLKALAAHSNTFRLHYDRPAAMFNYRTSLTVGTRRCATRSASPAPASASRSSTRASPAGTTT